MHQVSPRQVHLDFHTSECIEGIGRDFDPETFAQTAKNAFVSSMTVFARCHHGWLYYDSQKFPERVHPHLENRSLLAEQVKALHAKGIKAPVYITVQADYYAASRHPEWLIRKADGAHMGDVFFKAGFGQLLCINTSYYDFLVEHTVEVMELLGDKLDGLFFDIVGIHPCFCAACRAEMKRLGIDMQDEYAVLAFAKQSLDRFKHKMSKIIRERNGSCSIFYNAGHIGPCTAATINDYTHFELESLPSGGWGYLHFPVSARYARKLGKDCLGMTGKFHTSWGDFHSLKNLPALEFEAFRALSYGFGCSIGDQLEPGGRLNQATYRLIGKVFKRFSEREAWARPSTPVVEAALLTAEDPLTEHKMPDSILGAVQLLEELSVQFDILDRDMPLNGYRIVILPDDFRIDAVFADKLERYVAGGGRVIACDQGGLTADDRYPACFGTEYLEREPLYPNFIIAKSPLCKGLEADTEYAVYLQGAKIRPSGAETVLRANLPYFARSGEHFCSHLYAPSTHNHAVPCGVQKGNVILFAYPMFRQYRDNAPRWVKTILRNALNTLLPDRIVQHDGPSTVCVSVLDQPGQNRTCVHVLHYIPVRKSAAIDIIEDCIPLTNLTLTLNLPREVTEARLVPEGRPLPLQDGKVVLPKVNGYAIVELK